MHACMHAYLYSFTCQSQFPLEVCGVRDPWRLTLCCLLSTHLHRSVPSQSQAVTKYGEMSWKLIAQQVPSRSHVQCLQRWKKALDPRLVKGPWSEEEDQLLSKLVKQHGLNAWKAIAKEITGRNTKQCRERWCNYLDPTLKRGKWTAEEDAIIMAMQKKVGNKWAAITKELPGRTDNQVKIRFNSLHRKESAKQSAEAYLSVLESTRKAAAVAAAAAAGK